MSDYLTTLVLLRDHRRQADLTSRNIETITGAANIANPRSPVITVDRLKQLENLPRHEPTYAEARLLTRILGLSTITSLMTVGTLHTMTNAFGTDDPSDLDWFRMSADVPLSIACRLTVHLGLDDPLELDSLPIHAQLWDILASGERGSTPGICPWCLNPSDTHRPTCLPQALWSPRSVAPYSTALFPRPARPRTRGDSHLAYGLKVVRAARGVTQQSLASEIGRNANYFSRIERLELKLTQANAEKIALKLNVPVERIFEKPGINGEMSLA